MAAVAACIAIGLSVVPLGAAGVIAQMGTTVLATLSAASAGAKIKEKYYYMSTNHNKVKDVWYVTPAFGNTYGPYTSYYG